jgi:Ran GTPase-activating protein (RanGAP) involved in mRNA processing and transport
VNSSVTHLGLPNNAIGDKSALVLADALKANKSVTHLALDQNAIGNEGASAFADALKVNTSVTSIYLEGNTVGDTGASAFADALKINLSVTFIDLDGNPIAAEHIASIKELVDRNLRFRRLFLFHARKMLLSLLCADECGVVWPYLLESDEVNDGKVVPENVEALCAELQGVVAERRSRLQVEPESKRRRLE